MIFGWLQVGEVVAVEAYGPAALLADKPWLADHPHLHFAPDGRNVLYIASDRLRLPGIADTGLSGGGEIAAYDDRLRLTCSEAPRRSLWRLPPWFAGERPLTYHADARRWSRFGDALRLEAVCQGQEFVLDCAARPEAPFWLAGLLKAGAADRREAA